MRFRLGGFGGDTMRRLRLVGDDDVVISADWYGKYVKAYRWQRGHQEDQNNWQDRISELEWKLEESELRAPVAELRAEASMKLAAEAQVALGLQPPL